jgi:hypothetical protein
VRFGCFSPRKTACAGWIPSQMAVGQGRAHKFRSCVSRGPGDVVTIEVAILAWYYRTSMGP